MMQEQPTHSHATPAEAGGAQVDDINIPLVAVAVAFFACLLAVTILSLQAWFMHAQRAEVAAQTLAQEDPRDYSLLSSKDAAGQMHTDLGRLRLLHRTQLYVAPAQRLWVTAEPTTTSAPSTATATAPAKKYWISIDQAMSLVSKDYQQGEKQ